MVEKIVGAKFVMLSLVCIVLGLVFAEQVSAQVKWPLNTC